MKPHSNLAEFIQREMNTALYDYQKDFLDSFMKEKTINLNKKGVFLNMDGTATEPQEAEIVAPTVGESTPAFNLGNKVRVTENGVGVPTGTVGLIKSFTTFTDGRETTYSITDINDVTVEYHDIPEANMNRARKPRSGGSSMNAPAKPQPAVAYTNIAHDIKGQDDKKDLLRVAVEKDMPVLLVGDTGTGKTSIVKGMADEHQKDYIRFNLTGETTVDEFVGKYILENNQTKWEDGILLQAMKAGKWLIVDEINMALPEILTVLHSLLDDDKFVVVANHNGEIVRPAEDFRFFATMNPVEEYAGTKELNKAFMSRFNMILNLDYPEPKIEAEIVQAKTGVDDITAKRIVDTAVVIRELKKQEQVFYTCSTRDLIQWGNLVEALGEGVAFKVSILGKSNGDAEKVADAYGRVSGNYADLKKKGYLLNIDDMVIRAQELQKKEEAFKNNMDVLREEAKKEILAKLGMSYA